MITGAEVFANAEDTGLTYDKVAPYLHIFKKNKDGVIAECPVCHDPKHLYVKDTGDKVLMYCHKCNADFKDIVRNLGITGGKTITGTNLPAKKDNTVQSRIVEEYDHCYKNPDGSTAYFKHRVKYEDGSKKFQFGYRDENGRQYFKKPDGANNLYNLDLLAQATDTDIVYIVEGEKCADAMVEHGLLATTSNTGAQKKIKLTDTDREVLGRFKNRIVIPDNDDKGMDYASAWEGADILPIVSFWPECPQKGDVADYFAQGGDAEKITANKFGKLDELDIAYIRQLDEKGILETELFEKIFAITEPLERQQTLGLVENRAKELKMYRPFTKCWVAFQQKKAAEGITSNNMTKFPGQLFALRCGDWQTDINGVKKLVSKDGTNFNYEFASPIPIMPTEILENIEDGTEKLRLAIYKYGNWRSFSVARSIIASSRSIVKLADIGVEVNSENAKDLVKYIADTVALNPDILPRCKSVSHLGWVEGEFVPYSENIKVDTEIENQQSLDAVTTRGELQEWIDFVEPLRKNIYVRLMMAASFASPLIAIVGGLSFVYHFWGGSGTAKTVSLMVAASVWGNPDTGKLIKTLNSTVNSMMTNAGFFHNLPVFYDELQTVKSKFTDFNQIIMRLTEGVDRGRMTQDAVVHKQNSWKTIFISTGEEPFTKSNSGGGTKNRVIEIELDGGKIIEDGNATANFVRKHYGNAGQEYIKGIDNKEITEEYNAIFRQLTEKANSTEKQVSSMSLLMVADNRASKLFFPEEKPLTADDVTGFFKSKEEVDIAERAYEMIIDWIGINKANFDNGAVTKRYGKFTESGNCRIIKKVLNDTLEENGFDFEAIKKPWVKKGYLVKPQNIKQYSYYTYIDGYTVATVEISLPKAF